MQVIVIGRRTSWNNGSNTSCKREKSSYFIRKDEFSSEENCLLQEKEDVI